MAEFVTATDRAEKLPIWPSIARILATIAIFVFHYLGLLGLYQYRLSVLALLTFSFLSGYLAHARGTRRGPWAVKRYFSVMIPHWIVITPVLLANWIAQYKPVSFGEGLVTFMGGNLFLHDPLYVITWYVTFVLLLYGYLLADSYFSGWHRLLVAAAGFVFFGWLHVNEYFLPFMLGLGAAAWLPLNTVVVRSAFSAAVARVSFRLQDMCYPFFLAHGGIQLVLLKAAHLSPVPLFGAAFAGSVMAAYVLDRCSRPLLRAAIAATTPASHAS